MVNGTLQNQETSGMTAWSSSKPRPCFLATRTNTRDPRFVCMHCFNTILMAGSIVFTLVVGLLMMAHDTPRPHKAGWTSMAVKDSLSTALPVTRAAYQKDDGTIFFFEDNIVTHCKSKDEVPVPPVIMIKYWPNLVYAGIHSISAILPDPNRSTNHFIHVFWNGVYALFDELKA